MWSISEIQLNPSNPRTLREDKIEQLKASIRSFERMLSFRPIVIDENNMILGGNARLVALRALGYTELPEEWVLRAEDLSEDQKREFIIKDNVSFGHWDWDVLANEWDAEQLVDWGLEVPVWDDGEAEAENSAEAKANFSVVLHPEQESAVQEALSKIKETDEYAYAETFGNSDVNGNALYVLATSIL